MISTRGDQTAFWQLLTAALLEQIESALPRPIAAKQPHAWPGSGLTRYTQERKPECYAVPL
jgi:hypothetical protein